MTLRSETAVSEVGTGAESKYEAPQLLDLGSFVQQTLDPCIVDGPFGLVCDSVTGGAF
jgi:hypothetical protein